MGNECTKFKLYFHNYNISFDFKMNGKEQTNVIPFKINGFFFSSNVFINRFFVISKRNYDGICPS